MDLRSYLDSLPAGGVSALADRLQISRVYLSQLAAEDATRQPSPSLCVSIEQVSGGAVTRPEMRSDWKAIWPELDDEKARV
jgi:DNA-binding transcriptional regulator YdaS (Cro superfamily)